MPPHNLISPPATPEPTAAEKAATEIRETLHRLADQMIAGHQSCFNLPWSNPTATPAEILAALGTGAREVFDRGADLVGLLLGETTGRPTCGDMQPEQYVPPLAYTPHSDGRVTLD